MEKKKKKRREKKQRKRGRRARKKRKKKERKAKKRNSLLLRGDMVACTIRRATALAFDRSSLPRDRSSALVGKAVKRIGKSS